MSTAYWSMVTNGHWALTVDGTIAATAIRENGRWVWTLETIGGASSTLDGAMLAVGRARSRRAG